jgi:hypothetical protein
VRVPSQEAVAQLAGVEEEVEVPVQAGELMVAVCCWSALAKAVH